MKKYAIATAVLSTNLTACADPIIGDWVGVKATSLENSSESVTLPYTSCTEDYTYVDYDGEEIFYEGSCSTTSFDMTIDSDLTGTMNLDFYSPVKVDLEAENRGSGEYDIKLSADGDSVNINCTLADSKNLTCNMDFLNASVDFEK